MARKLVIPPALNLRSGPSRRSEIIDALPVAHTVKVVGQQGAWSRVDTQLDGRTLSGFVSSRRLREPGEPPVDALLREAGREFRRFDFGKGRETDAPFSSFVGEMWRALGLDLDGTDVDIPWSAAFTSFVVRNAGYSNFRFSASHSKYIHDAIVKRRRADRRAPYWGYRIPERKPRLGDLVCQWRGNRLSFAQAAQGGFFKSHCDIVIQIKPRNLVTLGGNLGNSVRFRTFPLDKNGRLRADDKLLALLRNRADRADANT